MPLSQYPINQGTLDKHTMGIFLKLSIANLVKTKLLLHYTEYMLYSGARSRFVSIR